MQGYIEVVSARILDLISGNAEIDRIAAGFAFSEGPVWKDGYLLFNDIPNSRTVRLRELPEGTEITTFRAPSDKANGMTLDHDGRLIVCEGDSRSVTVVSDDGQATTLFDRYQGKRFNSPNDLAIKSNGEIYFTDPIYGLPPGEEKELEINGVFAADRHGTITLVTDELEGPNGIAFSPDERTLYVVDSAERNVVALDLDDDRKVRGQQGGDRYQPARHRDSRWDESRSTRRLVLSWTRRRLDRRSVRGAVGSCRHSGVAGQPARGVGKIGA